MSRQNLEIVAAAFNAYYSGDRERLAAFAHPDLVVTQPAETPDAETYHGPGGFIEAIEAWQGEWDDFRLERLRTRDLGDHVLTTVRQHGRGRRSGAEVEGEFTFVLTLDEGKLVRWQMFADEGAAIAAVGREPAISPLVRSP